ncbi:MAG: SAM-dependent methyltransferase [Actinomadura sp.]
MTNDSAPTDLPPSPELDTGVSHSARVWNHWLDGTDNFAADREAGDRIAELYPDIVTIARAARAFLGRTVRYLAVDRGIRQFLDIGAGLPTAGNTHQIAQRVARQSRVVYVDNDPLVLAQARALLTSSPEGRTAYVDADLRDPDAILREAATTLDFTKPIAITLIAVLHHISDYGEARAIVHRLIAAMPAGSHLVISHSTNIVCGRASDEAVARWNEFGRPPVTLRSTEQITGFFDGLELLWPGVVSTPRWRPDPSPSGLPPEVDQFCGVARKP